MSSISHSAGRLAAGAASDIVLKSLKKDREKSIVKLVDFIEK